MGSFANITGRIAINPPIPWREFADSPYYLSRLDRGIYPYSLLFEVEETAEDTEDGVLIRREAIAIIPHDADEMRGDDIGDVLASVAQAHGRGRTFIGRIDVWWPDHEFSSMRYQIVGDSRVVEYAPTITWPPELE